MAKPSKKTTSTHKSRLHKSRSILYGLIGFLILALVASSFLSFFTPGQQTSNGRARDTQESTPKLPFSDIHTLDFDPNREGAFLLGTHENLFTRGTGEEEWKPISEDTKNRDIMGLVTVPNNPQKMVAGGHGSLIVSTNGGTSWQTSEQGLPSSPDTHGLTMSPQNPQKLYAFITGQGIFQSSDQGKTWDNLAESDIQGMSLAVSKGEEFFLVGMDGLYRGKAQGGKLKANKVSVAGKKVTGVKTHPVQDGLVYTTTTEGFYASEDSGNTWARKDQEGLGSPTLLALGIDKGDPNHVTVIDNRADVYESLDGGVTWHPAF